MKSGERREGDRHNFPGATLSAWFERFGGSALCCGKNEPVPAVRLIHNGFVKTGIQGLREGYCQAAVIRNGWMLFYGVA